MTPAVTALYEVLPAGVTSDVPVRGVDSLRYQRAPLTTPAAEGEELLYVKLRYKEPAGSTSRLLQHAVVDRATEPSLDALITRASGALGADEGGFRQEFIELARTVQQKELIAARCLIGMKGLGQPRRVDDDVPPAPRSDLGIVA